MDLSCPACSATGRPHSLLAEGRYRLLRCPSCHTQYFRPEPAVGAADPVAVSEYWEAYKFDIYGNPAIQAAFAKRYDGVLDEVRAHVRPLDSVLDIGCGVGNFLGHAEAAGLRAVGSDVDAKAVQAAQERGFTAYLADELDDHLPDGSVDAVSMWDVVEHLFEPLTVLRGIVRKLRPGGVILFETPDAGFPVRSVLLGLHRATRGRVNLTGPMYYWEHKVYFTAQGMRRLLDSVGVDVVSVRRETSVREKMAAEFQHNNDGSPLGRFLATAWPAAESVARWLGLGNKLLVVGRKRAYP